MAAVVTIALVTSAIAGWAMAQQVKDAPARNKLREPDAPYVPTPHEVVKAMLDLAQVKSGDVVYDLGCGDGRIVIAAAKRGAKATGWDIDPERVKEAKVNVKENKVEANAEIILGDIFTLDLSGADVIAIFLWPKVNVKLIPQLQKLKPGSRIVSHAFDMEGVVKPDRIEWITCPDNIRRRVYLWTAPLKMEK